MKLQLGAVNVVGEKFRAISGENSVPHRYCHSRPADISLWAVVGDSCPM
jgi:hypothetical protein